MPPSGNSSSAMPAGVDKPSGKRVPTLLRCWRTVSGRNDQLPRRQSRRTCSCDLSLKNTEESPVLNDGDNWQACKSAVSGVVTQRASLPTAGYTEIWPAMRHLSGWGLSGRWLVVRATDGCGKLAAGVGGAQVVTSAGSARHKPTAFERQ